MGGLTNGNPVVVRVAIKPTASISSPQITLNTESGKPEELRIKGRHDACIALRAPVVVEAAAGRRAVRPDAHRALASAVG